MQKGKIGTTQMHFMKSRAAKFILFALSLLAAPRFIHAVPLQRPDVPADPMWLIHMDFDRLRNTTVGQFIVGELEKPEAQAKFAAFQAMFKLDLRTQLHGVRSEE